MAALVVDTAPLVAAADRSFPGRARVQRLLTYPGGPLVVPAPVTAEVDYLLATKVGRAAQQAFLADLAAARFEVACLDAVDHARAVEVDARHQDLHLGLAGLSVVLAAERYGTRRLLTYDERHFRVIPALQGGAFTLLPADG